MNRSFRLAATLAAAAVASNVLAAPTGATPPTTAPARVALQHDGNAWRLLRDGRPYFIQGAGGGASKALLAKLGGNSFRTWGVGQNTQAQLDEAKRLGLSVTLGLWLRHAGDKGFSYADAKQVAEQLESFRASILKYKDHPALLCWAVGNETEGFKAGDDPNVWRAINDAARLVKELDPNHPTMTVVAEIGGARVKLFNELCPDVDILGINSYGGVASVGDRYAKAGGTRPYVVTEFGPPGTWEGAKNKWGTPIEPTSTQKGEIYRKAYEKGVLAQKDKLCLGSYAFTWGHKQEATATWYGLLLPDETRLEAANVLSQLWTGKPPANACPRIEVPVLDANDVAPGAMVHATLKVSDPDGDPVAVRWELCREGEKRAPGGTGDPKPPSYPQALADASANGVTLTLPAEPGIYRLFAYATDGQGNGATANVPIRVGGGGEKK